MMAMSKKDENGIYLLNDLFVNIGSTRQQCKALNHRNTMNTVVILHLTYLIGRPKTFGPQNNKSTAKIKKIIHEIQTEKVHVNEKRKRKSKLYIKT